MCCILYGKTPLQKDAKNMHYFWRFHFKKFQKKLLRNKEENVFETDFYWHGSI